MEGNNMDLREYLFRHRISLTAFCEITGYSKAQLSAIKNEKRNPGPRLAKEIVRATNGIVTIQDLMKIIPLDQPKTEPTNKPIERTGS